MTLVPIRTPSDIAHILVMEVFVGDERETQFSVEVHYEDRLVVHRGVFPELENAARLAADRAQGEAPIKLLMQWKRWGGAA